MMLDELLRQLSVLPQDTDVVVNVGRTELDIVELMGVDYPADRNTVALLLHPGDLRDAFAAQYLSR